MNALLRKCHRLGELLQAIWLHDPPEVVQTIAQGRTDPPPHHVKEAIIRSHLRRWKPKILCETGTFRGDMIARFLADFERIVSIEINPELHEKAVLRFAEHRHVQLWKGDSAVILGEVLQSISEPCLFWLDGHYSGGETGKGSTECPLLEELNAIFAHPVKRHVILIDDARLFGLSADYPAIQQVKQLAQANHYAFARRTDILRLTPGALPAKVSSTRSPYDELKEC